MKITRNDLLLLTKEKLNLVNSKTPLNRLINIGDLQQILENMPGACLALVS